MEWNNEPPDFIHIAEQHCTPKQLDVLKLKSNGYGRRLGSKHLGISEEAWRQRMRAAMLNIRKART